MTSSCKNHTVIRRRVFVAWAKLSIRNRTQHSKMRVSIGINMFCTRMHERISDSQLTHTPNNLNEILLLKGMYKYRDGWTGEY